MAASGTPTTNLGLRIPLGTDAASVADINYNSNVQDQKIGAVGNTSLQAQVDACADGLAIVSNGNTHGAITSGQFVYVKNHSTLADGLYVASANISANGALSTSNLTANNNGGMNTLLDAIAAYDRIHYTYLSYSDYTGLTNMSTAEDIIKAAYDAGDISYKGMSHMYIIIVGAGTGSNQCTAFCQLIGASRIGVFLFGAYKEPTWMYKRDTGEWVAKQFQEKNTLEATDVKSSITNTVWNTSVSGLVLVQRKMGNLVIISMSIINANTIPSSAATELVPSNTVAKPYAAQRWSLVTQRGNTCIVTVTADGGITVQGYPEDIPATTQANFLRSNLMYFSAS